MKLKIYVYHFGFGKNLELVKVIITRKETSDIALLVVEFLFQEFVFMATLQMAITLDFLNILDYIHLLDVPTKYRC